MVALLSGEVCNKNESQPAKLRGKLPGVFPEKVPGRFPGTLPGKVLGRAGGSTHGLSRLLRGDDDGNSRPNTDGHAERSTTDRSGEPRWAQARRGGKAADGLRMWSKG